MIKMVKKINHKEFKVLIKAYYKQKLIDGRKIPLLVYGTFGVGKSEQVKDTAKEIGEKKGKIPVEWNKLTKEEKEKIYENPENYFILIDIRLSEFDSSDIKGLPDFKDDKSESIIWKIPYWAKVLEHPKSDGILFFDEINLATPLVISSTYKIIYDRIINESKINDNWLIIGCGNKDEDRAYTHELASPVRDRGGEVELVPPSCEDWVEWAVKNGIDSRIIGFLNWKPSQLHKVDFEDGQKFTTERGWARASSLINGVDDYDTAELLSSTAIGEGIAIEFISFCKIKELIKLDEIIKNPEKIKEITEIGHKYFIVSSLAELYKSKKEVNFAKIMKVSEVLHNLKNQEFVALLWRLCIKYNPTKFSKEFQEQELNNPLKKEYHKYIVD